MLKKLNDYSLSGTLIAEYKIRIKKLNKITNGTSATSMVIEAGCND